MSWDLSQLGRTHTLCNVVARAGQRSAGQAKVGAAVGRQHTAHSSKCSFMATHECADYSWGYHTPHMVVSIHYCFVLKNMQTYRLHSLLFTRCFNERNIVIILKVFNNLRIFLFTQSGYVLTDMIKKTQNVLLLNFVHCLCVFCLFTFTWINRAGCNGCC